MEETKKDSRRTFRGFIYEFFVIFIAVTLGFLADNYRENIADSKKERQYAINLVRDLKRDTTQLSELISFNEAKQVRLDSFAMFRNLDFTKSENLRIFYTKAWGTRMYLTHLFRSNQSTLHQLKSTGDLRLLREKDIVEKVLEYDLSFQSMQEGEKYFSNHTEETWRLMYQLTSDLNRAVNWDSDSYDPPKIIQSDKLYYFFNLCQDLSWTARGYVGGLYDQKDLATELITILEERYNLVNEAASR